MARHSLEAFDRAAIFRHAGLKLLGVLAQRPGLAPADGERVAAPRTPTSASSDESRGSFVCGRPRTPRTWWDFSASSCWCSSPSWSPGWGSGAC